MHPCISTPPGGRLERVALHLLAFLLLLIPATYQAVQGPREKTPVRLIEKIPPPPTPPVPVTPKEIVQVVPKPRTQPVVPPLPRPPRPWRPRASRCRPPTGSAAAPSIDTSTPLAGAQLQYQRPPPTYPIQSLRNHEQGTVLLRVEVDSHGQPVAVGVERSSGSRNLDQAARQQVLRHWRFEPAQRDGVAVPAIGLVPVQFSLPD